MINEGLINVVTCIRYQGVIIIVVVVAVVVVIIIDFIIAAEGRGDSGSWIRR